MAQNVSTYQPVIDNVVIFPPVVVSVKYHVTIARVKFPIIFLGHLQQIKVIDPVHFLGTFPVVHHPALRGHLGILMKDLSVEFGLDSGHGNTATKSQFGGGILVPPMLEKALEFRGLSTINHPCHWSVSWVA